MRLFGKHKHHPRCPVFGMALSDLLKAPCEAGRLVPSVVEDSIRVLEAKALDAEGLFRKCPSSADVDRLRKLYVDGASADAKRDALQTSDVHAVAGLLKQFLRELPEPLLTRALYDLFVTAGATDDERDRVANMRLLALGLPKENRAVLRVLLRFLRRVAEREEANKMGVDNLAIVFGPTLLATEDTARILRDTQAVINVVLSLITSFDQVFGEPGTTPSRPPPPSTPAAPSQPAAPPPPQLDPQQLTPVSRVALQTVEAVLGPLLKDDEEEDDATKENSADSGRKSSKRRKTGETSEESTAVEASAPDFSFCAESGLDTTAADDDDHGCDTAASNIREQLEQWTAAKDMHKRHVLELGKRRQQHRGVLTAEERTELHEAHLQYKHAGEQMRQLQQQLAATLAPPPLPSPYDEMSIEQLRSVLRRLHGEKRELALFLTTWKREFERKHRRRNLTAQDRAPVAAQYRRYQELRPLVETIRLNLASV